MTQHGEKARLVETPAKKKGQYGFYGFLFPEEGAPAAAAAPAAPAATPTERARRPSRDAEPPAPTSSTAPTLPTQSANTTRDARYKEAVLARLGRAMVESNLETNNHENHSLPAGYTFLGQFIAHDLTFDPTSINDRTRDLGAVENFRTPALDLDCIYGSGPLATAYLYDTEERNYGKFLLNSDDDPFDIPRNRRGYAFIADPRNDHNLILSQMHLAFLNLHNQILDRVEEYDHQRRFEEARRLVRWLYQYVIVNDFLEKILHEKVYSYFKKEDTPTLFYKLTDSLWKQPYIPLEFSLAAFRFGHAQLKPRYRVNDFYEADLISEEASEPSLVGLRKVTANHRVDWSYFFEMEGRRERAQHSRLIRPRILPQLMRIPAALLPPENPELPALSIRTFLRGLDAGLISGPEAAKRLETAITDATIDAAKKKALEGPSKPPDLKKLWPESFTGNAYNGARPDVKLALTENEVPLWYYILWEAETQQEGGKRLGFLGSWIVAEVIFGILNPSKMKTEKKEQVPPTDSYLEANKDWKPDEEVCLQKLWKGDVNMSKLLAFAAPPPVPRAATRTTTVY